MIEYVDRDWREAEGMFETMVGECPRTAEVMYLVGRGDLKYQTVEWKPADITEEALEAHRSEGNVSTTEGDTHLERKLQLCAFFEQEGRELPTRESPSGTEYRCFEESVSLAGVSADVLFETPGGQRIVAEIGYTPAERVLRLFGFSSVAPPSDIAAVADGDLIRESETEVETVYIYPYNESRRVHCFTRTSEIEEPDPSRLTDRIEDALDL